MIYDGEVGFSISPQDKKITSMNKKTVAVAGANGELGTLLVNHLLTKGAKVKALVRSPSDALQETAKRNKNLVIVKVEYSSEDEILEALSDVFTLVSTLQGTRSVIVDLQARLLQSAIKKGVKRFIPSDYAANYLKSPVGINRNFDLRREFRVRAGDMVKKADSAIQITSIFNGGFMELLTNPLFQITDFKSKSLSYFGSPDLAYDYTTYDNTAEFTAFAALDPNPTPTIFSIAGQQITMNELGKVAKKFDPDFILKNAMGLWGLKTLIAVIKCVAPGKPNDVLPLYQKLQYARSMAEGLCCHDLLDNCIYPVKWTKVETILGDAIKKNCIESSKVAKKKSCASGLCVFGIAGLGLGLAVIVRKFIVI